VITPTQDYRRTSHHTPKRLLKGMDASVNAIFGIYHRRAALISNLREEAEQTDAKSLEFKDLTDHLLRQRLFEYRDHFRRGGKIPSDLLLSALAAIRESASRQLGLRPFVVQLMGALALHRGFLAEMATGEGKTLTAGLAAVLAGWTRQPCHIVTVNDYLVQRDASWLKNLYEFCGVKYGCVTAAMVPQERREGYACDITYATSKEILADFLRDRLQSGPLGNPVRRLIFNLANHPQAGLNNLVMRGLHTAIVDEADSVLIDEAVTPLIISMPRKNEALREAVQRADELAEQFEPGTDYQVNHRYREVEITPAGHAKLNQLCSALPGIWRGTERRVELVRQALEAREFFIRGKQYIVSDEKIVIVDEFTGRPMPQRSWRQGMHQAIEAKEGLPGTDPTETIARLSFQRFFRLYHRLSGMTGTAKEAAGEFWQIYKLPVATIPTNKPCVRVDLPDRLHLTEAEKWKAVADEVERVHLTGRPVLVGTRSVAASERLAALLNEKTLSYRLLNAVQHQEEAQIIAAAGEKGRITIATNMAGRGTDIKLDHGVAELGGLHVIATERHESRRVDRQLFGRSGRQGDPGTAQAFVSAEDELLRRYMQKSVLSNTLRLMKTGFPGSEKLGKRLFTMAQGKAQAIAFRQRKNVLKTDEWLEESLSFAGQPGV
jgi:preprotein translocase subunit SecA